MAASKIYRRDPNKLKPNPRNARTHSDKQVEQIIALIDKYGWTTPILVDENDEIIAGHGRQKAALKMGLDKVPVIIAKDWAEDAKRAYILADNQVALNAGWDEDLLASEISDLMETDIDMDMVGFDESFLSEVLKSTNPAEKKEPATPEYQDAAISREGDLWICGPHRVICGDGTSEDTVNTLMDGAAVDCVYTDPPYGVSIVNGGGKVGGDAPVGKVKKGTIGTGKLAKATNYAPVIGDDSIDTAVRSIRLIEKIAPRLQIIWGGNYYANELPNSPCWIVWDKENGKNNFADCELAWTNQKTAVRQFKHMWNGMLRASERSNKRVHPTQKPVALAVWCLETYGENCNNILDMFTGSGSTLLACHDLGKRGFMIELSPNYIDVIVKRWQDYTGQKAILNGTDKTFDQITAERTVNQD